MAQINIKGAGGGSPSDVTALYQRINRLAADFDAFGKKLAQQSGTVRSVLTEPTPCATFIVGRRVRRRGERPTMCFQWNPNENVQTLRAVVWMINRQGTAYEQKFSYTFKDITDANRQAGAYSGQFGKTLPFLRRYRLTRIVVTDDEGAHTRAPADDPATNNPPPFTYGIIEFSTGAPGLDKPATHNLFRNGAIKRSKYKSRRTTRPGTWTTTREGRFAWAWFVNCDRGSGAVNEKPITTSNYVPAGGDPPSSGTGLVYDKDNGRFFWNDPTRGISQRIEKGDIAAGITYNFLMWARRSLVVNPITANLKISICNVSDTRASGGTLTITRLKTVTVYNFGSAGASTTPPGGAAPLVVIPIEPPVDEGELTIGSSQPLNVAIEMPATYTVASTPEPNSDSSGLWVLAELENVGGNGHFIVDRIRFGYGIGDHVDHPRETGDPSEDDIDTVDVISGRPRGGGTAYGHGSTSWEADTGGILRPSTD